MPSPLLFFIFIIVIDLVLKSAKDKKKIEQSRQKRTQEMQKQPQRPKPMQDLKKVLEQELEKERQREISRRQEKFNSNKTTTSGVKGVVVGRGTERSPWDGDISNKNVAEIIKPMAIEVESKKSDLEKDILRGIIFSEILSEPKSIQNQKRSS